MKPKNEFKNLVRKTIYVTPEQDTALKIMAAIEKVTEYDIVIKALENYIPKEYIDIARGKK